ncbi:MAG TPA: hypothetical protein VFR09_07055 [Alphaproteobacteria bacterium]|nr:hypothetical protein [Alphaproteobacteria bacterium]
MLRKKEEHIFARTFTGALDDVVTRVNKAINNHNALPVNEPSFGWTGQEFRFNQGIRGTKPGEYSGFVKFGELSETPRTDSLYYDILFGKAGPEFEEKLEHAANQTSWLLQGSPSIASNGDDVYAIQAVTFSSKNPFNPDLRFGNSPLMSSGPSCVLFRMPVGIDTSETCAAEEGLLNYGWHHVADSMTMHQGQMILGSTFAKRLPEPYGKYNSDRTDLVPLRDFRETPSAIVASKALTS